MVKSAPMVRSFNAGIFSALMEGRVDLEFYPASMRRARNCILTPQGPVICRSGTRFVTPVSDNAQTSELKAFVYNNEQAKVLEFASDRIRFVDEDGVQVYAPVAATVISTSPLIIQTTGGLAVAGQEFVLDGFPVALNLNGETSKIVSVVSTSYTMDRNVPADRLGAVGTVSLVYSVPISYTAAERKALVVLQDVDIIYLLCSTKRTLKLSRFGDYDWRLSDVEFIDGPYLPVNDTATTVSLSGTGNAVPNMTTNSLPAGSTATGSGARAVVAAGGTFLGRTYALGLPATDFFHAFDTSDDTYWASTAAQTGIIEYQNTTPFVCTGYTIYAALDNNDTTYLNTDFAPSTFYFEGYDGANWITLDYQEDYVAYDGDRSGLFEIANQTAYGRYRLRIVKVVKNGPIEPRVRRLVLRDASVSLTLTASGTVGINRDQGFKATDVDRLIRIKGTDNFWRWLTITGYTSPTIVTVRLENTPFLALANFHEWRLGIWSDTTGWASTGDFFGDRLYLGPSNDSPNVLCGSVVGLYENFTHVEENGEVLDDGGIVHYIKSPQLSRIKWIISNEKGMVVGTGSQEFSITVSSGTDNLTQRNIKSRPTTNRGSTDANALKIDGRILHVPRNGRTLREHAYSFESDGYVSNNLSRFASQLGVPGFASQAYAQEPHTIDYIRRGDNSVVALTYNRDEGVVGFGEQDFASAEVESIVVIPQQDQQQDALWLETKRVIAGEERRYIEYMTRSWDFGMTLDDAIFVDCALVYDGAATTTLYGAQHLNGRDDVYGLARVGAGTEEDPIVYLPFGPITVADGTAEIPFEAEHVVIGLGFESTGETSRLENGATNGTAQGKVKRINDANVMVWDSATGEIGTHNEDKDEIDYEVLEFPGDADVSESYTLTTDILKPDCLAGVYSKRGSVSFRRPIDKPLPFNIVAIMPDMMTYE